MIFVAHTLGISSVLSLTLDCDGCLVLVSVLMVIPYVLAVRPFPEG